MRFQPGLGRARSRLSSQSTYLSSVLHKSWAGQGRALGLEGQITSLVWCLVSCGMSQEEITAENQSTGWSHGAWTGTISHE